MTQPSIATGLIGFGLAGSAFHAPLIAATPGLRLAGIASSQGAAVAAAWPDVPVFADPAHPYTQGLLSAIPRIDTDEGELAVIPGQPPDMSRPPQGCAFGPRCAYRRGDCDHRPPLASFAPDRWRACFAPLAELRAGTETHP